MSEKIRLKIVSRPYKEKCPACGEEITIWVPNTEPRGEHRCRHCGTIIEYDISDEIMKEKS